MACVAALPDHLSGSATYGVTARTTASGVRVRTVQVVRRRIAPVCRVMVGLGF